MVGIHFHFTMKGSADPDQATHERSNDRFLVEFCISRSIFAMYGGLRTKCMEAVYRRKPERASTWAPQLLGMGRRPSVVHMTHDV